MELTKLKKSESLFGVGLKKLGFEKSDDALFLIEAETKFSNPEVTFHILRAKEFEASAIFLRKQINGSYKPQVYLYDFTDQGFNENKLTDIQKKIWSSGEVPLVCIFYATEIKILDCTKSIGEDDSPTYLEKNLTIIGKVHNLYNEQFAIKIKSGIFWEQEENKKNFKFQNSSYETLIKNIKFIISYFKEEHPLLSEELINKIIVQSILIKYLEERIDSNGNKLLSNRFFKKYDGSVSFNDVLQKKGKFVDLLEELNDNVNGFNGNVFYWSKEEKLKLQKVDLSILAELLNTNKSFKDSQYELWRYFEFKYIPVELISRLYEEFLTGNNEKEKDAKKKEGGIYYTPSHLVRLLVDEAIPLKKFKEINLDTYKILDPACGSGIFLVTAFKRLVQIWRLQNNMQLPQLPDLKRILSNIYGVDKDMQAVRLTSFSLSLALCNELDPIEIINKLKFDDLTESNIIHSDFFSKHELAEQKFNLIIGNPPFKVGAIQNYSKDWDFDGLKVNIPQGQIALKFLSESFSYLREKGLVCLIIKSSGLLYNSTSEKYKNQLFSKLNVVQILDFTALARNNSLWENGADVATAAIFIKNEKPDFKKNVLHVTFRRTKAIKERIIFEIDDYDLHFVNRQTAIENNFIWKNNLLGGGRIKTLVDKFSNLRKLDEYLSDNDAFIEEGFEIGSKGELNPDFIYDLPFLPTKAINEDTIDYSLLDKIDDNIKFSKIPIGETFIAPNLVIWENIGENRFPIFFNKKSFSFQRRLIAIKSKQNNIVLLKRIFDSFEQHYSFYKFYFLATSAETLINRNNTFLLKDLKKVPFITKEKFSNFDYKIMEDSRVFLEDFFISGENSKAVQPIHDSEYESFLKNYGDEFSKVLNLIYEEKERKFRLTDVVTLDSSFIATIFKYTDQNKNSVFHKSIEGIDLINLSNSEISRQLSINRIIKLYPQKDTIVFIKPNQYRYWISLIAYRDADKCFADLSRLGF